MSCTSENVTMKHDIDQVTISNNQTKHNPQHDREDADPQKGEEDIFDHTTNRPHENNNTPTSRSDVTNEQGETTTSAQIAPTTCSTHGRTFSQDNKFMCTN